MESRKIETVIVALLKLELLMSHYLIIESEMLQTIISVVGKSMPEKCLVNFIQIKCNSYDFIYTTHKQPSLS